MDRIKFEMTKQIKSIRS